jgi:DNA-binding GntR family transcriptional regulator
MSLSPVGDPVKETVHLPKIVKLQREPLTRRAVQAIRHAIFAGEYEPGQHLVEEALAASLGVSRNVVREAFWQLEAEGLVDNDDYKGKSLTSLSVPDMIALIPLRLALESLAASWAARKVGPEDAEQLQNHAAKFTQGLSDFSAYAEIDFELHQMIWKLAGNRYMRMMLDRIAGPMIALQTRIYPPGLEELIRIEVESRQESHRQVVEAVCSGDPIQARVAMQKHILAFWQMWLKQAAIVENENPRSMEAIHDAISLVTAWSNRV